MRRHPRRELQRRRLLAEKLECRRVLSANPLVCSADDSSLHSVPFAVSGGGDAPGGLPLFTGGTSQHFATGQATRLGNYSGSAVFEYGVPTSPLTGTFKSAEPFKFGASNGDQIAFDYGADTPGEYTIIPQPDGLVVVEFIAEFTLDLSETTGRFGKYTEGSFTMLARTDPFSPVPNDLGFTEAFTYSWEGQGSISFPTGNQYVVTSIADAGIGSLREAIDLANTSEGIDTISFAEGVDGEITLESELKISDDLTICGPGEHDLAVSGDNATRVINIDPFEFPFGAPTDERVAVEIHDLTISDGVASDAPGFPTEDPFNLPSFAFGGGIYNRGGDLVLESVTMKNNQAGVEGTPVAAGGAIGNEFSGTIAVNHTNFKDNSANAVHIAAGGAITQDVGVTFDGLGTERNPAMVVSSSSFSRNTSNADRMDPVGAGGFAAFAGFAMGGGIFNLAGDAFVEDSIFAHNAVNGGEGFEQNTGGPGVGGAIFSNDFSPFITNPNVPPGRDAQLFVQSSSFKKNASNGGRGGQGAVGGNGYGGAIAASIAFFPEAATITESRFYHNSAEGGAGGSGGGDGGTAVGGGVAALAGASITVDQSYFLGNSAIGGRGNRNGSGGDGLGGGIGLSRLTTSVPTPFELDPFVPSAFISNTKLLGNRAQGGTGGHRGGDGGNGLGGGLGVVGGSIASVVDSLMAINSAVGGRGSGRHGIGGDGLGGGLYNGDAQTTVNDSRIVANVARGGWARRYSQRGEGHGGGIFNSEGGKLGLDQVTVDHTRLNLIDNIFGEYDLI